MATVDDSEEPLFADNLDNFLDEDDDIPPLPPPLSHDLVNTQATPTTTSQPTTSTAQDGDGGGQTSDTRRRRRTTVDGEDPPAKVRKPMLKFTVEMLFKDKGIPYIVENFPKLKFKGKGHEVSDLKALLKNYEIWANNLFPKLTFHDFIQRVEKLGATKEYSTSMSRFRMKASGQEVDDIVNSENEGEENDNTGNGVNGDHGDGGNGDNEDFPSLWDVVSNRGEGGLGEEGIQQDVDPYEDIAEDFDF